MASVDALLEENTYLKKEIARLNHNLMLLKKQCFGSKSERTEDLVDQLLFNEVEKEAAAEPPKSETITYTRKKGKGKKKPFPSNLPREEKIIDVRDEDKVCPHDGTALKEIGEERTEKLKTIPAKMWVVVEVKKKYACSTCESYCVQPKVNSILPGTIATPELLSFLIFSKFYQGLPLYRLEDLFRLNKVELSRGTMARWLIQVKEKLIPIYNFLEEWALESGYMAIDATHVQVLKEKGRAPTTKSFMWVRGSPEKGIVLFDYDPSGGGAVAERLMAGFKGALQADAHRGYGALTEKELLLLGCMMHSRRRFHNAWLSAEKKPGLAEEALSMFGWVYDREADYKAKALTPLQRKQWRDKELGPSLHTMKGWMEEKIKLVPKSSPVANAMNYFINEYPELTAFLKDGRYEIDNGWIERTIRKFAIGRNNWMFCDTVDGAHASSLLYSLVITAKLNGKDPTQVLTQIFYRLPDASTADDYEVLAKLLLSPETPLSCHKKEG